MLEKAEASIMFENRYYADDDNIFSIGLGHIWRALDNNWEFVDNPTEENLQKALNKILEDNVYTLREDFKWYAMNIIPKFLKKVLK